MLTHRTNLLLPKEDYFLLSQLATKESKTMGELIRNAIQQVYIRPSLAGQKRNMALYRALQSGWNVVKNPAKKIDYKALVNYGRTR